MFSVRSTQALRFRLTLGSIGLCNLCIRLREHHRNCPRPRGPPQPTLRSRNWPPRALKENRELAHGTKLSDSFRKINSCHSAIFESRSEGDSAATHLLITSRLNQSRHQSSTHASLNRISAVSALPPKAATTLSDPGVRYGPEADYALSNPCL